MPPNQVSGQEQNLNGKIPEQNPRKPESEQSDADFLVEDELQREANHEPRPQSDEGFLDDAITRLRSALSSSKKKTTVVQPRVRDDLTLRIENIMQIGLEDAYKALTPIQQQEFKLRGEEAAWKIRDLLRETHIKIKKIFRLLIEWLKILPGINRFYLEQEAKIKADQIISLHKQNKDF